VCQPSPPVWKLDLGRGIGAYLLGLLGPLEEPAQGLHAPIGSAGKVDLLVSDLLDVFGLHARILDQSITGFDPLRN
jgi:hypothetical protein